MNLLPYVISWYLTVDFPTSKPLPCRNETTGSNGICTYNSSCFTHEIIGSCADSSFDGVCCRIPKLDDSATVTGFSTRENEEAFKAFVPKPSSNRRGFAVDGEHDKRDSIVLATDKNLEPIIPHSAHNDESPIRELSHGAEVNESFDGRRSFVPDTSRDSKGSFVPYPFQVRQPVAPLPSHDLRKPVVLDSSYHQRRPVHDLRKPVAQAHDFDLRVPVEVHETHDLRRPALPNESHDLRWPVLEEDSHDRRLPVGSLHEPLNGDKPSTVDSDNTGSTPSVPLHSETEISDIWPPFEFRNIKILPKHDYLRNELRGSDDSDIYPDVSKVCGRSTSQPTARLVGGVQSSPLQWPWMVSLRLRLSKKEPFRHRCGAALLNEFWVITAAHCVQGKSLDNMKLRLGDYRLQDTSAQMTHVERGVFRMEIYPSFDPNSYENDLALLLLDESVDFEDRILPICLPLYWNDEDLIGKTATVTGWGRLSEGGKLPEALYEVYLPILANRECQKMYADAGFRENIRDVFICAGFPKGGSDTCDGDSGGPLMVSGDEGEWTLIGLVSWGKACAAPKQPGVYTRITKFVDWILEIITF